MNTTRRSRRTHGRVQHGTGPPLRVHTLEYHPVVVLRVFGLPGRRERWQISRVDSAEVGGYVGDVVGLLSPFGLLAHFEVHVHLLSELLLVDIAQVEVL